MEGMNVMMQRIRNFMIGRYGVDQLMFALWILYFILVLVARFTTPWLQLAALAVLFYLIWRMFSRNGYARSRENEKFLAIWRPIPNWFRKMRDRARDTEHRYFKCPACKATLRLPRGKGKIAITCPRCQKEFVKRT